MRANDITRTAPNPGRQLVIHGARHMFCVPGESYIAALDACHGSELAVTICRHESGAAIMAEAVGKATGRPGICFVTRGPGTNASAGVHIARQDSPLILFVGQIRVNARARGVPGLDYRATFDRLPTGDRDRHRPHTSSSRARSTLRPAAGRAWPPALPEDMLVASRSPTRPPSSRSRLAGAADMSRRSSCGRPRVR
jgi:acetolactate synthase-1/2/3 large subunit